MRQPFRQRTIYLVGPTQAETAINLLREVPLDYDNPLEVVIREKTKVRGLDANALMWVGPLKDIAEQAWWKGQQFIDEVWHNTFKRLYLPEEFDPELCKEGYVKWAFDRDGNRVLIGSTTRLTKKGFSQYLEKVYADGASMGVEFTASPNEVHLCKRKEK